MGSGSMKNQFKRADKSGAALGIIIGEEEAEQGTANVKVLRRELVEKLAQQQLSSEQQTVAQNDVLNVVTNLLDSL